MIKEMIVPLLQGDRGLYTYINNKIHFPDHSWKNPEVGLCKVTEVTKEKDTYAFIKGEMIHTDKDFVCDSFLKEYGFDGPAVLNKVSELMMLVLSESSRIFRFFKGYECYFFYQVGGKTYRLIDSVFDNPQLFGRVCAASQMYDAEGLLAYYFLGEEDLLGEEELVLLINNMDIDAIERPAVSWDWIDKKYVRVLGKYYFCINNRSYSIDKEIFPEEYLKGDIEKIDLEWFKEHLLKYGIAKYPRNKGKVYENLHVKLLDGSVPLKLFTGGWECLPYMKDKDKLKEVQDSMLGLEKARKNLAKAASKGGRISKEVLQALKISDVKNFIIGSF